MLLMPRLWIEYHPALEPFLEKESLLRDLFAACEVPTVNPALIKARLVCPQTAVLGPWNERETGAYLYVLFEWLEGRSSEIEALLLDRIRSTLREHTQVAQSKIKRLSVTFEVRKILHEQHHSL